MNHLQDPRPNPRNPRETTRSTRQFMPSAAMSAAYSLFSRNTTRGFKSDSRILYAAIEEAKNGIRNSKSLDDIPPFTNITREYGTLLVKGILISFVKGHDASRKRRLRKNSISLDDLVKFDWNLENIPAVAAFSQEAFVMAGVQTNELRAALFEEAKQVFASGGTYRDWADTFSMHGFEPGNPYHLRTNYDTAANAAYSAAQWEQINANKDLFKYLRYVTMQEDKVRDEHQALDGLIYHVDDPFWNSYMPPNGWNCRCSVEQIMESELPADYTPLQPNSPVIVDPMFLNNPGKTSRLISPTAELLPQTTNWLAESLPEFSAYPQFPGNKMINTSSLSLSELKDLYKSKIIEFKGPYLAPNSMPCFINDRKGVIDKFDSVQNLKDLRARFKYLNYLPDIIKHPDEIWLINKNGRLRPHFLKHMQQNIVIVFELENGFLDYFNLSLNREINALRQGVFAYNKSLQ